MKEKFVEFQHEGDTLEAYLAVDSNQSKKLPAVMISHTWRGRSDFECDKARALAALGYVGFAIDLYGKGVLGQTPEESGALMQPFLDDRAKLQSRMIAALDALKAQEEVDNDNIVAMGYCFGGLCVLDLARTGGRGPHADVQRNLAQEVRLEVPAREAQVSGLQLEAELRREGRVQAEGRLPAGRWPGSAAARIA